VRAIESGRRMAHHVDKYLMGHTSLPLMSPVLSKPRVR